jgi:Bromodomain
MEYLDWNPAVDKQAAARCWRDGQKKRCFTYRFLATGTVEEKIFQRQLSKEGLQSVVDDKEQVNALSTKDLRNLFKLRAGTPSDTHDKLRCERCEIIHDNAEMEAAKKLPKQLTRCRALLDDMVQQDDAKYFLNPMVSQDHGVSTEQWEKIVKQPMDFATIRTRLAQTLGTQPPKEENAPKSKQPAAAATYKNVSSFSKDVNRIFSNCLKVWEPEKDEIADAARRLQAWWIDQWTALVPQLMTMKADEDETDAKARIDLEGNGDVLDNAAALRNERGDDFQEQLGMPDEENMRSWSHHHTTDTVDDPIFRAAMRGYDSVSFVFGLEVTWSLLQQRAQEEEEEAAMREVEAMRELEAEAQEAPEEIEDEEDENDVDENSDETEAKGADEEIEAADDDGSGEDETDTSKVQDDEEDEANKDADEGAGDASDDDDSDDADADTTGGDGQEIGPESTSDADRSVGGEETPVADGIESESCVVSDARESHQSPVSVSTESESPLRESPQSDVSECPDAEMPLVETTIQSPLPEKSEKKPPKGGWKCEVCTFVNQKSVDECSMCESIKPESPKKRRRRS